MLRLEIQLGPGLITVTRRNWAVQCKVWALSGVLLSMTMRSSNSNATKLPETAMNQTPCGHLRELEKLINDELPPDQAARLVAHVETCEPCQRQLERLVTRPLEIPLAPTLPGRRCDGRPHCPGIARLRCDHRPDRSVGSQRAALHAQPTDVNVASMTGCHSSGETTDLSPAVASSLGMELASTDHRRFRIPTAR